MAPNGAPPWPPLAAAWPGEGEKGEKSVLEDDLRLGVLEREARVSLLAAPGTPPMPVPMPVPLPPEVPTPELPVSCFSTFLLSVWPPTPGMRYTEGDPGGVPGREEERDMGCTAGEEATPSPCTELPSLSVPALSPAPFPAPVPTPVPATVPALRLPAAG